ncbi:MAG: YggS family pyridoxal phosphate-dependent enzyme [Fimbriimonadaceae bacterium]|nr:YggS family pyridoxal phosphate-dependent enzyme [Fimbriimonadaceae bacterium]QYK59403.1 MAG: YggS family pyridoxal phosphate-dependent enzyme [Fimbriimonadaceae bacterium]
MWRLAEAAQAQNWYVKGLQTRLAEIERRIETACLTAGRHRSEVQLVAVTKTVPLEVIKAAYDLGLRHFGESRLQEARPKIEALPDDIVWHFVGRLQSNKAKAVAETFAVVHTFEKGSQLVETAKSGRVINGLVEVNIANEQQKAGVLPEALDKFVSELSNYPQVRFRGLMTIGPLVSEAGLNRPVFKELARLGKELGTEWLSMGMSGDFDVAIQEGATHVRIGTALFGERA